MFKKTLRRRSVIGPFSKTSDPAFVEAMGHAGFDFVILDLEHGPNNVLTLQNLIRAAQISDVFPIVRVKGEPRSLIGEVLDIGAGGIQIPQITTAEEARRVIHLARFSPTGRRGVCRYVRAADYSSADRFAYFKAANEALIVLQLEGEEAMHNLDGILQVPGVDIIFIGPYDLSQSLGVTGEVDHPRVVQAAQDIIARCSSKGIVVGIFAETLENAWKWTKLGVGYVGYSVDVGLFTDQCRQVVQVFKTRLEKAEEGKGGSPRIRGGRI
jgi:4-hydroxy-2-oxoheptanedioate aldolase